MKLRWFSFNKKSDLVNLSQATEEDSMLNLSKQIKTLSLEMIENVDETAESWDNTEERITSMTSNQQFIEKKTLKRELRSRLDKGKEIKMETNKPDENNERFINAEWQLKLKNLFDSEVEPNSLNNLLMVILKTKRLSL